MEKSNRYKSRRNAIKLAALYLKARAPLVLQATVIILHIHSHFPASNDIMRVLVVDAFDDSRKGRAAFRRFEDTVRSVFAPLEALEHGGIEFVSRHFTRGLEVRLTTTLDK